MQISITSRHLISRLLLLAVLCLLPTGTKAQEFGQFLDQLKVTWLDDGRKMQLLADFRYRDPSNEIWVAKKGAIIDGASIPRAFWTLIGGPFEGRYRNASVIHDYYCDHHVKDWRTTHRNFYLGMRAGGVTEILAKTMFYAVFLGGPRWEKLDLGTTAQATICIESNGSTACKKSSPNNQFVALEVTPKVSKSNADSVQEIKRRLEAGEDISLDQLENRALSEGSTSFPMMLRQ